MTVATSSLCIDSDAPTIAQDYLDELCRQFSLIVVKGETANFTEPFYLQFVDAKLALLASGENYKPIVVDFLAGKNQHRAQFGGGKSQLICKAVGVSSQRKPSVLDLTAGLGADGFALASLGCKVRLHERNPMVAALLYDGVKRLHAVAGDSLLSFSFSDSTRIDSQHHMRADVVYLDPMYPDTKNSAISNKEMRVFKALVGGDDDSAALLDIALQLAEYRVVVKRPRKGDLISDQPPTYQLTGKSSRYDIYVNKGMVNAAS